MPKSNLVFDFDALKGGKDKRQLNKFKTLFGRYQCPIKDDGISVDEKTVRKNGVTTLGVQLFLVDDQTVNLRVKETGDIYEVKINNRLTPITAQDDTDAAIKEICDRLIRGRAAFLKAQSREKTPDVTPKAKGETPATLTQKVSQRQATLDSLNEQIEAKRERLSQLKATSASA